jgi:hypothetical protein
LEERQATLVATAFKGLLKVVNRFTSTVIEKEVVYHEGECGYWRDGAFVSSTTFSGVEELVMYVGLCVSLASQSQNKVVVIDEMTRAIGESKRRILLRLLELVADGTIDQAIVADGPDDIYAATAKLNPELSVVKV